jgi:hypothetical protein
VFLSSAAILDESRDDTLLVQAPFYLEFKLGGLTLPIQVLSMRPPPSLTPRPLPMPLARPASVGWRAHKCGLPSATHEPQPSSSH